MKLFKILLGKIHRYNRVRELNKTSHQLNSLALNSVEEVTRILFTEYERFFWTKQVQGEFEELLRIFHNRKPQIILEIGTATGGSLFAFTKLAPANALIISIDLPYGMFGGGYDMDRKKFYETFSGKNQKLFLLQEDSHKIETFEKVKNILGKRRIDFLFIDGDHTLEGVRTDCEMFSQLCNINSFIAFHDVAEHHPNSACKVHEFWNEIKYEFAHSLELIEDKNQAWAGIGIVSKSPLNEE